MYLKKLFPAQSSELLNKRWVFNVPEAPKPLSFAESLARMPEDQLLQEARKTRADVNEKVIIAEDLISRLEAYTGDAAKTNEKPLIEALKALLKDIGASEDAALKEKSDLLRERGRDAVDDTVQKLLLFRPSKVALSKAFENMKQGFSDVANWGTGKFEEGFEKLMSGFEYIYRQVRVFMPTLPDIFGQAVPKTPAAPAAPAPAPTPDKPKEPEKPVEVLDESVTKLNDVSLSENDAVQKNGQIAFSVFQSGKAFELKVDVNGENTKYADDKSLPNNTNSDIFFLPKYLKSHKEKSSKLFNKLGLEGDKNGQVSLMKALVGHQMVENVKAKPKDLINLLADKWEQYTGEKTLMEPPLILEGLKKAPEKKNDILSDFISLPALPPAATPTPSPTPAPAAPAKPPSTPPIAPNPPAAAPTVPTVPPAPGKKAEDIKKDEPQKYGVA